jgi:hypothetical protein
VRREVNKSIDYLSNELNQAQTRQGMLGQMAAQQRLRKKRQCDEKSREDEIERQLHSMMQFDSAVSILNRQNCVQENWFDQESSY